MFFISIWELSRWSYHNFDDNSNNNPFDILQMMIYRLPLILKKRLHQPARDRNPENNLYLSFRFCMEIII